MASTDLGERIRRLREARRLRGLSWRREDIAPLLGVSVRTLARWETGETQTPRSAVGALEEFYGVSLSEEVDPEEAALRSRLAELRDLHLMEVSADQEEQLVRDLHERRRKARANGAAEPAG